MALTQIITELITDSAVHNSKIIDNAVDAAKLDVVGNGTTGQALLSDGDGTFSWGQAVTTASDVQFNSLGIGTAAPTTAGLIRATNDVVAFYSSDKRLKDNIKIIPNALDKVCKLGGYEFDWNSKQDVYEGHDIGVIAQEVEAIFPELVATRDSGFKAVKYEKLIAVLIESIKELSAKINKLENKS